MNLDFTSFFFKKYCGTLSSEPVYTRLFIKYEHIRKCNKFFPLHQNALQTVQNKIPREAFLSMYI